jgi:7-cyano-7-deazaguanine reductase
MADNTSTAKKVQAPRLADSTVTSPVSKPPTQRKKPAIPPSQPSKTLDVFPNTQPDRDYVIEFQIPEFTCHCPLTGQPDFAHLSIHMVADKWCIELKSLKMYMWSYRNEGSFHEKVTNDILTDLVKAAAPRFARITAKWYVRGGIYTNVVAEYRKKSWKPEPLVMLPGLHIPALGHNACVA